MDENRSLSTGFEWIGEKSFFQLWKAKITSLEDYKFGECYFEQSNPDFTFFSLHCNIFRQTIVRVFNKINILPGSVACLEGGGVNTEAGPGVFRGCLATCRAEITTAWDPWYLKENFILNSFTKMLLIVLCQSVFFFKRTCP